MVEKEQISDDLRQKIVDNVFMQKRVASFIKKCKFSSNIYYNAMDGGKIKKSHIEKIEKVLSSNKF